MIFADTTFIIGYYLKKDIYHAKAVQIAELIENEQLMINNTVILEVFNTFKDNKYRINTAKLYKLLINMYNVDYLDKIDYELSLNKLNYYNESVNYNDCTILQSMEKYKISKILSFDNHFDKIKGITRIYL